MTKVFGRCIISQRPQKAISNPLAAEGNKENLGVNWNIVIWSHQNILFSDLSYEQLVSLSNLGKSSQW